MSTVFDFCHKVWYSYKWGRCLQRYSLMYTIDNFDIQTTFWHTPEEVIVEKREEQALLKAVFAEDVACFENSGEIPPLQEENMRRPKTHAELLADELRRDCGVNEKGEPIGEPPQPPASRIELFFSRLIAGRFRKEQE